METRRLIPGLAGLIWLAAAASAFAEGWQYSNAAEHYTLRLPEGWTEIPRAQMDLLNQFAGQINGQVKFATGFQRQDRLDLAYPYVLVQHHSLNGRPSLDEIFKQVSGEEVAREIGRATEEMARLGMVTTADKPWLDRANCRIYMPVSGNAAGVGNVRGLAAICVRQEGMVQLNGYATEAEWPAFAPVFDTLVDSLEFQQGYEYDERLAGKSWWHFDGKGAFGGALVGALVGGLVGALAVGVLSLRKLFAKAASRLE
jgi:hypothetical protein